MPGVGPAVLVLGLMRYGFVASGRFLPWLKAPLPQRFRRKLVCVLQLAVLILLQLPMIPSALASGMMWIAVAALLMSFGNDALWLWRRR